MADKMATWRQVGVKMARRRPKVAKTYKNARENYVSWAVKLSVQGVKVGVHGAA